MRVCCDIDGTMYSFQGAYTYMAREYLGVQMPPMSEWEWDTPSHILTKEDQDWMWTKGVELGLFRYGHIIKGTVIGVRKLHEMGYSLSVVTHRPRSTTKDTIAWLDYINLPFDEVHILSDGEPKSSVSGDILIDDKPENMTDWHDHGRRGVLFSQPWNQDFPWKERAAGWAHVVRMLSHGN